MTDIPKSAVPFLHYWVAGFHVKGVTNRAGTKFWVEVKYQVFNKWRTYNVFTIDRERAVRLVEAAERHEAARNARLDRETAQLEAAEQAERDALDNIPVKTERERQVEAGQADLFTN